MDHRCAIQLQYLGELLEPNIRETVLAQFKLSKTFVVFDDFGDNMNGLVTKRHVGQV